MPLIDPGTRAPNFTLRDQHGEPHTLQKYRGRVVVLYFYPKDDTPDCTIEACQFRDHHPDFSKVDAAVLGISPDSSAMHLAFVKKHMLNFPLLADDQRSDGESPDVSTAYGAWADKSLFGRKYRGVARMTYVIDAQGVVRRRWDRVKVAGHAADVLATVKMVQGMPAESIKPSKKRTSEKKARRVVRTGGTAKKTKARGVRVRMSGERKVRGKAVPKIRRRST